MPHILCKLTNAELPLVQAQLSKDAAQHAERGMFLEHLWTSADHPQNVLFLFRVNDLASCQVRMKSVHVAVREQHPDAKLPEVVFLQEA